MSPNLESENTATKLKLPALEFGPLKHAVGHISHVLGEGGVKDVISIEDIQVSSRIREKLYKLSDGQAIIVTERKKLSRPSSVDGILQIDASTESKWLSHRLLDEFQENVEQKGLKHIATEIAASWNGKFSFHAEERDKAGNVVSKGLRPPQIGGLHAIGSHWSLNNQPATIVMPTGTGKTETMLATLIAYASGRLLVVVPSRVLRDQTAKKFLTLGLLRSLGNLMPGAKNPIVGIVTRRPRTKDEVSIFEDCNVVVATMSALTGSVTSSLLPAVAEVVDTLIVDEAHHVAAKGWASFRENFSACKVLQFTATPYRRDGKLVDGKVIYEYPLQLAQRDGYFKKISFESVYEIDQEAADQAIAKAAVDRLREDVASGKNHIMMARCANISRASYVCQIYQEIAPDLNPVLVHSDLADTDGLIDTLRSGGSRIVVCVNMLGEGFDLPQLKVAAIHDTHKSLAILLQFTGRFTRSSAESIGDATVIANIAEQGVSSALERLYSEDADWNHLLSELSSDAARSHASLVEFLNSSQRLDEVDGDEELEISHHLLRPTFSTLVYEAASFNPKRFFKGIPKGLNVHRVWLHEETNTLYFVTRLEPPIRWTRSKKIRDRIWDLFVLHYDQDQGLLFLSSSDKSSNHEKVALAVGGTQIISGDIIFRSLGNINRLIFQNVGVRKHGRRNLRYALYTGSDVAEALSISERAGSIKSNLSGTGWENGGPVTIGCSYKGRIWAREPGTVPELVRWCEAVGRKLKDDTIDTKKIIENVLIPEEVTALPDAQILSIDWPVELIRQSEERVTLLKGDDELSIAMFDIEILHSDATTSEVDFQLRSSTGDVWGIFKLTVGGIEGFRVTRSSSMELKIRVGSLEVKVEEYFSNYPPLIRFMDLSELDGNLLIRPQSTQDLTFPVERFEVWDWEGVDISKESMWKEGAEHLDSIQWRAAQHFIEGGFDVVFNDDASGEAADLVCLKEEDDHIRLTLVHCKFTKGSTPGERVNDVVEVCSQAIRSAKWKWKFRDLCRHVLGREKRLIKVVRATRFLVGQTSDLNRYVKVSRFKEIRSEIVIVQPGLSLASHTPEQAAVLAAAHSYLKETIGTDLDVICSA